MTNEVTVPLLPCASIDDIETFYGVLGFRTTYKQRKPNACVGVQREDLHLQFFEIAGFDPEQSYGSCLVLTADLEGLHRAFAAGMRAAYGKGYCDALTEDAPGSLCHDHGYRIPARREVAPRSV